MKVVAYESARGCSLAPGQVLDLSEPGLYFIKGGNGQGKSTLLKDLASGEGDRSYESAQERLLAATCPGSLVSYVAQTWDPPSISVGEFLHMADDVVNQEVLRECRCALGVADIADSANLRGLSGGELQRLAICLGVAKSAPYLLIDEPSNHLDDGATKALRELIGQQARIRRVVVSTHDPRMQMSAAATYMVEEGQIFRSDESATPKDTASDEETFAGTPLSCGLCDRDLGQAKTYPGSLSAKVKREAASLQTRGMAWLGRAVALVVMANLMLWCGLQLQSRYCQPEEAEPDVLFLSAVLGGDYQELNENYAAEEGLSISEETWQQNLTYEDLKDVASMEGVASVYVENPAGSGEDAETGRAVEAVLSKDAVQGLVEDGEYLPYDSGVLPELLESSVDKLTEQDLVLSAVVLADEGCEVQVLDALVRAYPACYVASDYFIESWARSMNRGLFLQLLAVMVIGAALGAALVLTARHGVIEEDRLRFSCLGRFFLQDLGGCRRYRAAGYLLDLLPGAVCFGVAAVALPEYVLPLVVLAAVSLLVMMAPSWLVSRRLMKGIAV